MAKKQQSGKRVQIYLVGGAVRDELLGYPFTERDYVVVGASPAQMLGEALAVGISDSRIGMQSRMTRLVGHVFEDANEVRQQFHIARAVMEAAGKAEFACAMPGHFTDGHHDIPCAIPGAALLSVEAVSAGAGVGEGGVDMTVAIDAQVAAAALPRKLARVQMRVATTFRQKTAAGQSLDFGQDLHLVVGIDETAQSWRLVVGGGQKANETAIGNLGLLHAPPRNASR